jgi:cleavage and polyadenylation specificity factor subunit 3
VPKEGSTLSGLLVAKDSTYTLLAASDLQEFTGLSTTVIRQQQRIQLNVGWDMIRYHLESMYGEIDEGLDEEDVETFRVMQAVDVKRKATKYITLEWCGSTTNDMIADSVLALLLGIDRSPATVKSSSP